MSAETPRELPILSAGAAQGLVRALQQPWLAAHGIIPVGAFGAVGAMRERLLAGDPCDVIVLTDTLLDDLQRDGLIVAGSRRLIGSVATGVAVCELEGRVSPAIGDADSLRASLQQASAVYLPDPQRATAGIHFAGVLRRLGLYESLEPRLRPYPNGAAAMTALAASGDPQAIGCTQVSEIVTIAGVRLVGDLPGEFGLATPYAAAVTRRASDPQRAAGFVDVLTGPATRTVRLRAGFN